MEREPEPEPKLEIKMRRGIHRFFVLSSDSDSDYPEPTDSSSFSDAVGVSGDAMDLDRPEESASNQRNPRQDSADTQMEAEDRMKPSETKEIDSKGKDTGTVSDPGKIQDNDTRKSFESSGARAARKGVRDTPKGVEGARRKEAGGGKPFAPEHWPNKGDVWKWRVGCRHSNSFWCDRSLYPPHSIRSLPGCPPLFRSKLPLQKFLLHHFPNMNIDAFFDSFIWRVPVHPDEYEYGKAPHEPEEKIVTQEAIKKNPDTRSCKAGNPKCGGLLTNKEEFSKKIDCNICCSESKFCGECSCILCGKVTSQSSKDFTAIRCEGMLNGERCCAHVAHLECASLTHNAGVKKNIGLDVEYYCRRCDTKTDLLMHVKGLINESRSVKAHAELEKKLNLALSLIQGTQKEGLENLQKHLEAAIVKIHTPVDLEDNAELQETIAAVQKASSQNCHELNFPRKHEDSEPELLRSQNLQWMKVTVPASRIPVEQLTSERYEMVEKLVVEDVEEDGTKVKIITNTLRERSPYKITVPKKLQHMTDQK